MNEPTMTHGPGCTRPDPWRDRFKTGWVRLKCPECKHVANVAEVAQVRAVPPVREPVVITATGYRCRDHHDEPVTWRGTGCTRCATDLKGRKAPKRDDYEELRP